MSHHLRFQLLFAIGLLLAAPAAAAAHAVAGMKSPLPNAQLAAMPRSVDVAFSEPVKGDADALVVLAADGTRISGPARIRGSKVTAAVNSSASGRYGWMYTAESLDGHIVSAAYAFAVRARTPAAVPVSLLLSGRTLRLSGGRVGVRTARLWPGAREGTLRWTSPLLPAPFVWTIHDGVASGLLPFSGSYAVEARVRTGTFSELIVAGTTTIDP